MRFIRVGKFASTTWRSVKSSAGPFFVTKMATKRCCSLLTAFFRIWTETRWYKFIIQRVMSCSQYITRLCFCTSVYSYMYVCMFFPMHTYVRSCMFVCMYVPEACFQATYIQEMCFHESIILFEKIRSRQRHNSLSCAWMQRDQSFAVCRVHRSSVTYSTKCITHSGNCTIVSFDWLRADANLLTNIISVHCIDLHLHGSCY
jgi:hypothetical protein